MADDITAFIAAHPPRSGFSAAQMINVWEHLASLADVEAIATEDPVLRDATQDKAASRRQLVAAVRWVQAQAHHGDEPADAFVTYLGDTSSIRRFDLPGCCPGRGACRVGNAGMPRCLR
ncbi:hypothetical protein [Streptomyces sp. CC224B]|uniref:hypothetical protein n=1 Tax=Streptomyces sp. CC224B TaxID=3044571 RepID=UPI0024A8E677|nr:hypothetical protein [Streptomyces sp. CC224B]